jgi:hypothetical protein
MACVLYGLKRAEPWRSAYFIRPYRLSRALEELCSVASTRTELAILCKRQTNGKRGFLAALFGAC